MSIDDTLAKLTAGLDRDEELARETSHPDWDANFEGAVWDSSGWVADVAGDINKHVARQDPAATLRRVEAMRQLIATYRLARRKYETGVELGWYLGRTEPMKARTEAFERAIEILASIYTEDTPETEGSTP